MISDENKIYTQVDLISSLEQFELKFTQQTPTVINTEYRLKPLVGIAFLELNSSRDQFDFGYGVLFKGKY